MTSTGGSSTQAQETSSDAKGAEKWVAETFDGWIAFLMEQIPKRFNLRKLSALRILKKTLESRLHQIDSEINNSTDSGGCAT